MREDGEDVVTDRVRLRGARERGRRRGRAQRAGVDVRRDRRPCKHSSA